MIKGIGQINGIPTIYIGISRENWERLLDNQPIMFDGAQVGIKGHKIVVLGGETKGDIVEDLRSVGLTGRLSEEH